MNVRTVTKQLAAREDLLLGYGTEDQVRASGTVTVNKLAITEVVPTINDLPTTGYDGQVIEVLGYHTVGDGGGGTFRYSTTSATNNGGTIILPSLTMPDYTGTAGSCWHRQYDGAVNVKWFGAASVNATVNTMAIQSAIDYAISLGGSTVYFPSGTYEINDTIDIALDASCNGVDLIGVGMRGCVLQWAGAANGTMVYYHSTDGSTGSRMATIEGLALINGIKVSDTDLQGVIGFEIGARQVEGVTTTGSNGVCNVTIRKNFVYFCDTAIKVWSESDQLFIENNYLVTYKTAAIQTLSVASTVSGAGSATTVICNNVINGGDSGSYGIDVFKSASIEIRNNTIQPSVGGQSILLQQIDSFVISNNYTEAASVGSAKAFRIVNSSGGYIGENHIGGFAGGNLIEIDIVCRDITIGCNDHYESGGSILAFIDIAAGVEGINIIGTQRSTNSAYTNLFSGAGSYNMLPIPDGGLKVNGRVVTQESLGGTLVTNGSFELIKTIPVNSAYLVTANSGNFGGLMSAGYVCIPEGSTTPILFKFAETNAGFSLSMSNQDLRINNTTGGDLSAKWTLLRLY